MRVRHRPPSIFSLAMVDVFCCALGCVLLLWLWQVHRAKYHRHTDDEMSTVIAQRDQVSQEAADLRAQLAWEQAQLVALNSELARQGERIAVLDGQLRDTSSRQALTARDLEGLRALLDRERVRAGDLEKEKTTLQDRIRALQALADRLPALERDLAAARDKEKELGGLLRARDKELASSRDKEKELTGLLGSRNADLVAARDKDKQAAALLARREADLAEQKRQAAALASDKAGLEKAFASQFAELQTTRTDLAASRAAATTAQARIAELLKEGAANSQALLNLQDEKKALQAQIARMKASEDSRFAGITLTGRRVVFLVDISGSMLETAGKPDPGKWAGVVETVLKVMQSLPDLEAYQLVVFSKDAAYPLGYEGKWLGYDPDKTPGVVRKTLLGIEPKGGTNVYAGLEKAFKLRAVLPDRPLDTIYLFSDGLPSQGAGVPEVEAKMLKDDVLARRLGDHVRKTLKEEWNKPVPNLPKVRIHSIGFYYDSPDVGAFLWALSRENDGNFVGMSKP